MKALFDKAVADMKTHGAEIVDPFVIPGFDRKAVENELWCDMFKQDVDRYLSSRGSTVPYKTLAEIVKSGLYAPYIKERIKEALAAPDDVACRDLYHEPGNIKFRDGILKAMDAQKLDAIIYPTWSNPPRKIGDFESPAGDNSQFIPPHTGLPGFTVPMGFTYGNLPAGLQIVGRLFGEPTLIEIAYAYEQATKHRRPPEKFPEL